MYLSQSSKGIQINPTNVSISFIPNLTVEVGSTIDMSQYIEDPLNIRTDTAVSGLTTFASYDSGTELLSGIAAGTETGVTLEVTIGGGQSTLFTENYSSAPLVSPWYDELAIQTAAMPADSDSAVYYQWDAFSTELPDTPLGAETSRRQFAAQLNIDFTFTVQCIDHQDVSGIHWWYFRSTEETQFQAPTTGFNLYLEPHTDGAMKIDLRRNDDTWSEYFSTVSNDVFDGAKHTVRMVAQANDIGVSNGVVRVWVDDVVVIAQTSVEYFQTAGQKFDQIGLGPYLNIPNNNASSTQLYIGNAVISTG